MKILWDFSIQTDRETNHRRPDITVHDENFHLSKHSLKNAAQWGFAKDLSAEGKLLSLTDRWKMELDKGLTVGAIFVDFRKAFDSLSHNILSL